VNFILPLVMEADMVTIFAYILVVAILFLAVIIAVEIASLLLRDEESPDIDLRDIEEPLAEGQNPQQRRNGETAYPREKDDAAKLPLIRR
jgi:hypothetical protein